MTADGAAPREFSALERAVLDIVQQHFPVTHAPFAHIAQAIGGTTEEEVHACVRRLAERGVIRRIGAVFDTRRLGFASTLAAIRVPEERIDEAAAIVCALPGVSHCYRRAHEYNLWFTLAAPSCEELQTLLDDIAQRTRTAGLLNLPVTRTFKINVNFRMT